MIFLKGKEWRMAERKKKGKEVNGKSEQKENQEKSFQRGCCVVSFCCGNIFFFQCKFSWRPILPMGGGVTTTTHAPFQSGTAWFVLVRPPSDRCQISQDFFFHREFFFKKKSPSFCLLAVFDLPFF